MVGQMLVFSQCTVVKAKKVADLHILFSDYNNETCCFDYKCRFKDGQLIAQRGKEWIHLNPENFQQCNATFPYSWAFYSLS